MDYPLALYIAFIIVYYTTRTYVTFFVKSRVSSTSTEGWTYVAAFIAYQTAIVGPAVEYALTRRSPILPLSALGVLLVVVGLVLSSTSIRRLGPYWSPIVDKKEEIQIVNTGPYARIRHPYYLGSTIEALGFPLILSSWYCLAFVLLVHIPLIVYRAKIEEAFLLDMAGEEYEKYRHNVPALMPRRQKRKRAA